MFAELHIERGRIRAVLPCAHGTVIRTEQETYNYPGCSVFPGFVDSHIHVVGLGQRLTTISLHETASAQQAIQRLAAGGPNRGEWILAMGWDEELWTDGSLPRRDALDEAFPDTPVVASRIDGHAMWVNRAALDAAGIHSVSESGVLVDDEMVPIQLVMPAPSEAELQSMIRSAGRFLSAQGITEVHDMDVNPLWLEAFRLLAENGTLPMRVNSFVGAQTGEWQQHGVLPSGGEFHRVAGVKCYADGALGSRGAFLLQPYTDKPDSVGTALLTESAMHRRCLDAIESGFRAIAIHAIGDAAVRSVLNVYADIRSVHGPQDVALRIEHAQHVCVEDCARFKDLNVIASVQPIHQFMDSAMAVQRLGASRMADGYRWQSFVDAGVTLIGGSDAPIASASVIESIAHCTNDAANSNRGSEILSRASALDAYTINPHRVLDLDHRRGSLQVGMDADLAVIDRDILTCSSEELRDAKVMATFTAGRRRHAL